MVAARRDALPPGVMDYRRGSLHASRRVPTHYKLSEEKAIAIRDAWRSGGVTQVELAAIYGVTPRMISFVIKGQNWLVSGAKR